MPPKLQQKPLLSTHLALHEQVTESQGREPQKTLLSAHLALPERSVERDGLRIPLAYHCWSFGLNIFFGLLGMLLLLALLPLLSGCIWLDSPGPIFYTQERLGHFGRPFRIYKFRSMRVDAEPDGKAIWAARGDARVTRIGQILRLTHLDELPQVLNILQGHMSLIGPRPEREVFARQLEQLCPVYRQRLLVKPGLTGWAQVKYGYGANSGELQKLYYDLEYIQKRSIQLDMCILLKTVVEVLTLRGR